MSGHPAAGDLPAEPRVMASSNPATGDQAAGLPAVPDEILERYGLAPESCEPLDTGSANRLWRLRASGADLVLKQSRGRPTPEWLRFQARTLEQLLGAGIAVPELIPSRDHETTIVGGRSWWQLRPWVEGRRLLLGRQDDINLAVEALTGLQRTPAPEEGPSCPGNDIERWLDTPAQMLDASLDELRRCLGRRHASRLGDGLRVVWSRALERLDRSTYDGLPRSLVHGELQGNNLLVQNQRLACILDWDSVQIRPRIIDIATAAFFLTRKDRGRFSLCHEETAGFLARLRQEQCTSDTELELSIPILQLLLMPSARLLGLMRMQAPWQLEWYPDWAVSGASSVHDELQPVLRMLGLRAGG